MGLRIPAASKEDMFSDVAIVHLCKFIVQQECIPVECVRARSLTVCRSLLPGGGGVWSGGGVSGQGGGVPGLGRCLVQGGVSGPGVVCLVWGGGGGVSGLGGRGWCVWSGWGVVYLVWGVVYLVQGGWCVWSGGCAWSGGVCAWSGGGLPQCLVGYHPPGPGTPPPVNRMTNRCKNITLATTSLRPVIKAVSLTTKRSTTLSFQ